MPFLPDELPCIDPSCSGLPQKRKGVNIGTAGFVNLLVLYMYMYMYTVPSRAASPASGLSAGVCCRLAGAHATFVSDADTSRPPPPAPSDAPPLGVDTSSCLAAQKSATSPFQSLLPCCPSASRGIGLLCKLVEARTDTLSGWVRQIYCCRRPLAFMSLWRQG